MKALKSDLAKSILDNPANGHVLMRAVLKAGYGPDNAVPVTVAPLHADGMFGPEIKLDLYFVPKADLA